MIDMLYTNDLRDHIMHSLFKDNAFDGCFGTPDEGEPVAAWRGNQVLDQRNYQHLEKTTQADFADDTLLWAVTELAAHSSVDKYRPLKDVMPVLEDLLSLPQTALPAGSRVLDLIQDISIMFWIQNSLRTRRPGVWKMNSADVFDLLSSPLITDLTQTVRDKKTRSDGAIYKTNQAGFYLGVNDPDPEARFVNAGELLRAFYNIKLSKRTRNKTNPVTLTWLDNAIASKTALDAFWQEVRDVRLTDLSQIQSLQGTHRTVLETWKEVKVLDYYQDDEYLSSMAWERYEISSRKADADAAAQVKQNLALAEQQHRADAARWQAAAGSTFPQKVGPEPTIKSPKRKRVTTVEVPARPRPPAPPPVPAAQQIPVSSDSLNIFARLWPNQSRAEESGNVTFADFLNAMGDAGCVGGSNKGSKWYFQGLGLHRIRIDAPHGRIQAVIERYKLLKHGKYLTDQWQWRWSTFTERAPEVVPAVVAG